jgi:transcriptional regulator of acetoin/glycerol metabolism
MPDDSIPVLRPDGSMRTLAEMNEAMIDYAIQVTGSLSLAADQLGVGRSTLYRHAYRRPPP